MLTVRSIGRIDLDGILAPVMVKLLEMPRAKGNMQVSDSMRVGHASSMYQWRAGL
jgi:hypothetical protein